MSRKLLTGILTILAWESASAQPVAVPGGVRFTYPDGGEKSVLVLGDFNGWSKDESRLTKNAAGVWSIILRISPGIYQYKFLTNGETYELDPGNPVAVDNYNNSAKNSIFVLTEEGKVLLTSTTPQAVANTVDQYPRIPETKPVYLNIIWHQHQPLYLNPEKDRLEAPWVRTHATKDYYDMAAMLRDYPDVHCTINLTSSLLHQLEEYYVNRLKPFVDLRNNRIDVRSFWKQWKGKTDPWIDLALKPTSEFDSTDKGYLYRNAWNALGTSEVMARRFPEYYALKTKVSASMRPGADPFTEQEMREVKFWFFLAQFDPDFLGGAVKLPDNSVCDLRDLVVERSDRMFYLKKRVTETDCQRIVVEAFKVMAAVVPVHKLLRYDPARHTGQIEIITTPYCHPILPLICNSDLAKVCQPTDTLPARFSYPEDAYAHVAKAVKMYQEVFGAPPTGMWPGEGAVGQPVLGILRKNGILWTATDAKVLNRSDPAGQPNTTPYRFSAGGDSTGNEQYVALVFRDTELSDRIGFRYQTWKGEDAAEDFVRTVLAQAPKAQEPDKLLTVILDGENAWEWYRQDLDAKEFLNSLYRKLSKLYGTRQIITTTATEYLAGNPGRGIAAHPVDRLPPMKQLWPGSWINASYDTWIGEPEENRAWEYLLRTRQDLDKSGIKQPDPSAESPRTGTKEYNAYMAWEGMYAAEGSDWFWWYGEDQTAPGGDKPFDDAFLRHLRNVYNYANAAGGQIAWPGFKPIIQSGMPREGTQGVMARSRIEKQNVVFTCDASSEQVPDAIYIAGSIEALGRWTPNLVRMYDDGSHGDARAGDKVWSLAVEIPIGEEVLYRYTNSGRRGVWTPGEEARNRTCSAPTRSSNPIIIKDTL